MKRPILFTVLILILGLQSFASVPVIDPELREEMNRMSEQEMIQINILMAEQADATALLRETAFFATKEERRDYAVSTLKKQAEASQADLLSLLEEMERNGMVTDIRPLWIVNAVSCTANKGAIESLALRSDLMMVYQRKEFHYDFEDDALPLPKGDGREIAENLLMVNADKVWELGFTGQGVLVAIIDTGVSLTHADLQGRFWDGGTEYPNHGYDFYSHDNDPSDGRGHGTHVAGTICGTGASGTQTGVAPDATLMVLKVFNDDELSETTMWVEAMQFAVEHGADVLNMSLGQPLPDAGVKLMMRQACDNTLAAGVVASVCAGNVRQMQSMIPIPYNIYSPADCPPPHLHPDQMVNAGGTSCVICVGAVDFNDNIAGFSSVGPSVWTDVAQYNDYPYTAGSATAIGLIRPDLCAPGVNIKSLDYTNNNGYCLKNGTSMATPCVTGTIALMLSKEPELTPSQIDDILERTAIPLSAHKSNDFGSGRIDALAAINEVGYDAIHETETSQVLVYPNPSIGDFTIRCEGMRQIEIHAVDGRLVESTSINSDQYQVNGLPKGVYLLKIETERVTLSEKIVSM